MRQNYSFNSETASKADSSKRSGAFVLEIAQCSWSQGRDSNSESVNFVLLDRANDRKFLTRLVTNDREGRECFGMGMFQAIMGLIGVQNAAVTPGSVYDLNGKAEQGYRIKALEKKTVGFVLQYVEKKDQDGYQVFSTPESKYPKADWEIRTTFDPQTRKTFNEVKDNLPAKRVGQVLARLEDKLAKVRPASAGDGFESAPRERQNAPQSAADVAEDIPF